MDNKNVKISSNLIVILIILVIVVIFIPIITNYIFINCNMGTSKFLGDGDWLAFWGNYSGGIIGGIATIIALIFTILFYETQEENHRAEMDTQEKKHREELANAEERQFRPILLVTPNGGHGIDGNYSQFFVYIKNIGIYAATRIKIEDKYIDILEINDEKKVEINSEKGLYRKLLNMEVESIIGKHYEWVFELKKFDNILQENDSATNKYYYQLRM